MEAKPGAAQNKENSANGAAEMAPPKKPQKGPVARATLKPGDGQALQSLEAPASLEKGEHPKY